MVTELVELLGVHSEEFTHEDLAAIETLAQDMGTLVREAYDNERTVGMRDRWMGRIAMRLREMHPSLKPTFVDTLHERKTGTENGPVTARAAARGGAEKFQTFSERVRNVVEVRERLERKQIFILSPAHTQKQLTLNLLRHLQRFKGMHTPIFVDTTLCEAYVDELKKSLPPYRLFKLGEI